ncbi:hypothetical protein MKQ70_14405 [Chitinophaga sedimenti]|uniref:hypothetical protein n=1 Tax=Chitinophaga sedimenti TaxID=2033606 RepID=UPI0020030868|nr:hypothetical protein [Chitinophaga sedimenti]MCK7556143.1 hypothetical protein [Chitinophaga sedimenti]
MSGAAATTPATAVEETVQEDRDAVQLASQYYGLNSTPTLTETPPLLSLSFTRRRM